MTELGFREPPEGAIVGESVPTENDQEQLDHRLTSLLWAHQFVSPTTDGRTGTAERRTPASGAAGSGGLTPDPEGGPQVDHRETNERRSGAVADGGSEVER